MVTRDKPTALATASSDKSLSNMNFERCAIPELYAECTIPVKENCTPDVLYVDNPPVHDVYMPPKKPKKATPRQKRVFQRTFIKQWRDYRNLSQEQLAERVTNFLVENGTGGGYTHASIGRLERGLMPYSQPILEALADALGTDPASLLIRDPTDAEGIWTIWEKALPAERTQITELSQIVVKKPKRA
jgi:transcriptional regulator with XRE-family HTH domain